MSTGQTFSDDQSRAVAESARDGTTGNSVLREIFLGDVLLDRVDPYPDVECARVEFVEWMERFRQFLQQHVNPHEIDRTGEYPDEVVEGLRELGAFGMKIPTRYGGLGFSQQEYARAIELLGTYCGNLVALLSAHQSIGVPQPVKLFGTEAQRKKFLPACARGAISAFALTEPDAGSDPGRIQTTAYRTPDGDYILDGEKLWTTNATLADLVVVMARDEENRISCFVVPLSFDGVHVVHRCHFMGLRAIANGVVRFDGVVVPKENRIGAEGDGLKIALTTLNTGRLSLPAACVGASRTCLRIARQWAASREQWGAPIGRHEAVAKMLAAIAVNTFAMESVTYLCNELADDEKNDIRLEAAAAKELCSVANWEVVDHTLQIRGGRGYETAASLYRRGEPPLAVERMLRDARINRIFEGSSEIMHLFMAREALDKHLQVAGALVDPNKSVGAKLAALPRIVAFYAWWYPTRWLGFSVGRFGRFGRLAKHVRFVHRRSRKLARLLFHGMLVYGPKLERRQAFLFRAVDTGIELFAMLSVISRAQRMQKLRSDIAEQSIELAEGYCRDARRRIDLRFAAAWRNDDASQRATAARILEGAYEWLEQPQMPQAIPRVDQVIPSKLRARQAAE